MFGNRALEFLQPQRTCSGKNLLTKQIIKHPLWNKMKLSFKVCLIEPLTHSEEQPKALAFQPPGSLTGHTRHVITAS